MTQTQWWVGSCEIVHGVGGSKVASAAAAGFTRLDAPYKAPFSPLSHMSERILFPSDTRASASQILGFCDIGFLKSGFFSLCYLPTYLPLLQCFEFPFGKSYMNKCPQLPSHKSFVASLDHTFI